MDATQNIQLGPDSTYIDRLNHWRSEKNKLWKTMDWLQCDRELSYVERSAAIRHLEGEIVRHAAAFPQPPKDGDS